MKHSIVILSAIIMLATLAGCKNKYTFKGKVTVSNRCKAIGPVLPPYEVEVLAFSADTPEERVNGAHATTDSSGAFSVDLKTDFNPIKWRVLRVTKTGAGHLCSQYYCEDTNWSGGPSTKKCEDFTDYKKRFEMGTEPDLVISCGCNN